MLRLLLFVLPIVSFLSSCSFFPSKKPVIVFDAEMSSNDLMSLYILSRSHSASLISVSPSGTDVKMLTHSVQNAGSVLTLANKTNIPLSSFIAPPLCLPTSYPSGWVIPNEDNSIYNLPQTAVAPLPITGASLMQQVISQSPEKVTVLCMGPLNNLANALKQAPQLKEKIERVVMLGGSLHTTESITLPFYVDWKENAIYNTFSDPCSANIVLTSGIPITLIPLDVIAFVRNSPDLLEEYNVSPSKNPGSHFVLKVLENHAQSDTIRSFAVFWDMIGIMSIIHPKLLKFEDMSISIITKPGQNFGRIIPSDNGTIVQLCTFVDRTQFFNLFFKMMNK